MRNLYLIIGPSGSGKTTIAEGLNRLLGMRSVESYTTRTPRYSGEQGHIFVTNEEFDALCDLCAYTEYNGYRYGVTKDILDKSDVYVIDPDGVMYLTDHYSGKPLRYIWLATSPGVCYERMLRRGDSESKANERVKNDKDIFGPAQLAEIRSRMPGLTIITDAYSSDQVLDIVKKKLPDLERIDDANSLDRSYSGFLEDE